MYVENEENALVDSTDDDVSEKEEEPIPQPKRKRQRGTILEKKSPNKNAAAVSATEDRFLKIGGYLPKSLTWIPGHYMPSKYPQGGAGWSKGPSSYTLECFGSAATEETYGHKEKCSMVGKKAARVEVLNNGDIDCFSEEKNVWDESVRNLVLKILDLSIVEWGKQKPVAVQKLRDALDSEFEYVWNPLSTIGFRTIITRFMKSEHHRLKSRWLKGNEACPIHVNGEQWKLLIEYWQTDA